LLRFAAASPSLTAAAPPAPEAPSSILKTQENETVMNSFSAISSGREHVVEGLRAEFGAIQADRILEAEAADFLWEARVKERYLGQHLDVGFDLEGDELELARVAILAFLDGRWHVAACLIDGEGCAVDLLWKRCFDSREQAEAAFDRAA
jgi:hypothetical protein